MKKTTFSKISSALVLALLFIAAGLKAQVLSNVDSAILNAQLAESLTVTVTGGSVVNFTLAPGGAAAGDTPVAIQTSWVLRPNRGPVKLVGYFDTTNALTDPVSLANIASANVFGLVATGTPTSFTAFDQTIIGIGTAGASLELFSEEINGTNKNKTRDDNLDLQIDLTSAPQQPAGDYTGTLRIRAIAI